MKVALLKSTFHSSGGLEKYCLRIAQALRDRSHQVTILTSSPPNCSDIPTVQICSRSKCSALQLLRFDWAARRWLKRHRQDVVFGFDRHFLPLDVYRAGNGCHAAYLERRSSRASWYKKLSFWCNPLHLLTLLSERYTFEKHPPKHLICNSTLVKEEIERLYPSTPVSSLRVVTNGVQWQEYAPYFERRSRSEVPHLLFIGHEWHRKGLEETLYALSGVESPFRLLVVGREKNPKYFIELARRLGIEHAVEFYGPENPIPFYQRCSIALLPSLYDPCANTTLEALAMGLFVITTHSNGASEIINDNGIVVDNSVDELREAIIAALSRTLDPEVIRESVRKYDFSQQLQKIVTLVEEQG